MKPNSEYWPHILKSGLILKTLTPVYRFQIISSFLNRNSKGQFLDIIASISWLKQNTVSLKNCLLQIIGGGLTPYLIETPFNTFANKADQDQTAL